MTNQAVETLRTLKLDTSNFKVVGRDPLPQGVTFSPTAVTVTGYRGDLVDWNIGARRLVINCQMGAISGIWSKGAKNSVGLIDIADAGGVTLFERFRLEGDYGVNPGAKPGDVPMVLKQRFSGSGRNLKVGRIPIMRLGVMLGFSRDGLKFCGDPNGQLFEDVYLGSQHLNRNVTSKPHFDGGTAIAGVGGVTLRRMLVDMIDPPPPAVQNGTNNFNRFVRNKGSVNLVEMLRVEECVAYHGPYASELIHIVRGTNFIGPVEYLNNWFDCLPNKLIYPGSKIDRWVNNRWIKDGSLIAAPAGAKTV